MSGEVIVGYDGEEGSRAALTTAVQIAGAFRRELVVVFGYAPPALGGEVADLARAVEDIGATVTADAVARARAIDPGVATRTELVNDRPVEALLRAAEACNALAIVVGSAARGPLTGSLLGSVTYQVVHQSPVPVVVVPLPANE